MKTQIRDSRDRFDRRHPGVKQSIDRLNECYIRQARQHTPENIEAFEQARKNKDDLFQKIAAEEARTASWKRKPAYESEEVKAYGLTATCNSCDRIIFEDENDMDAYTEDGRGYCKECREEAGI